MFIMQIVLVVLAVVIVFIIVSTVLWLPIPFLSLAQQRETVQGEVLQTRCLAYGVIKVDLVRTCVEMVTPDGRISTRSTDYNVFRVHSSGNYVHLRGWKSWKTPFKVLDKIEVEIEQRCYPLRRQSLYWVKSWKPITEITKGLPL